MTDQPTTPPTVLDQIAAVVDAAAEHGTGVDVTTGRQLLAEARRLQAHVTQLDRALGETIDDRDQLHEIADKLAYAVAPEEVIGEHSSMNCPWTNAFELITPAAEVDKLRARVAELEGALSGQARGVLRNVADMADPEAPEVSFFGGMIGPAVAAWLRMLGDHPGTVARLAAPAAGTGE